MLGFLRKDFYMLYGAYKKNLLLVFLLYAALVRVMKITFLLAILIWLMAFYGLSAITMDDSCGWDRYARTLPVSSGAVITARFLTILLLLGVAVAYSLILGGILHLFLDYDGIGDLLLTIALVTSAALATTGILLPAAYKWGVDKVRNTFMLVFILVFLTPVLLKKWLGTGLTDSLLRWLEELSPTALSAAALGVGLLVFALGGWVSARIYAKKEF